MGQSYSTPPPLVNVHAPGGRIKVPAYTPFTIHPAPYQQHQSPVFHPVGKRRKRVPVEYVDSETEVETEEMVMMEGPRMGREGMMMGRGGGGMMMGRGGRMGGMGRPHSAPGVYMGMGGRGGMMGPPGGMGGMGGMPPGGMMGPPGGMGGMGPPPGMGGMGPPPGMMGDPRMTGMPPGGMMHPPGGMGGLPLGMDDPRHGPYGMGNHNMPSMPLGGLQDPPPGYTQMPPRYPHPHSHPKHPPSPPASSVSSRRSEAPPSRRPSKRAPGEHERIPMGAYATSLAPKQARESTTAEKLNRGQSANRHVGPSGKEWIQGDAFLDACRCTTGCTCRGGHRVLYRSRDDAGSDSDASSTRPRYRSGEIRYILKTDMGKDCGDHSNCVPKAADSSSSSVSSTASRREKDRKKEDKKRKEEMERFKESIVDALSEGIRKARSSKAGSVGSPRPGFAGLQGGGGGGMGMGMAPDPSGMDPLLAQRMAAMGIAPGAVPPGITGLPPGVNPYAMPGIKMPPGMQDPRAMRSAFNDTMRMPMPDMDMDIDPRAFYARRARGGGGIMRRPPPRRDDYGSDDFDDMKRRQRQRGKNEDGFGDDSGSVQGTRRIASPNGKRNANNNIGRSSRERERRRSRQARADSEDEYE